MYHSHYPSLRHVFGIGGFAYEICSGLGYVYEIQVLVVFLGVQVGISHHLHATITNELVGLADGMKERPCWRDSTTRTREREHNAGRLHLSRTNCLQDSMLINAAAMVSSI